MKNLKFKSLVLLELNEINFGIVSAYLEQGATLPNFSRIIDNGFVNSFSESEYSQLEPWIQWPSIHTGKTFSEHKIFRLGDISKYEGSQLFEEIERRGYSVGSLSAMNAANRLDKPAFFIPDPWTNTPPDGSFLSRALTKATSQTVNDNTSGRITLRSVIHLVVGSVVLISVTRYLWLAKKLFWALRKPWRRAMFLDLLLTEYFLGLVKRRKPEFSTLFLNAGAHIQHHYMLSSPIFKSSKFQNPKWYVEDGADPLLEVYQQYDEMIGRLVSPPETRYIIATGLSQKPCDKPIFYYRLNDHAAFLKRVGIAFRSVEPRMTRDFLLGFDDDSARDIAFRKLNALTINGVHLFGQLDRRSKEIFVTMDYPMEITKQTFLDKNEFLDVPFRLGNHVNFVAIKNGEHQGTGFVFIDPRLEGAEFEEGTHVAHLHHTILSQFPNRNKSAAPA